MTGDPEAHVGGSDGYPWNSHGVSTVMDWSATQANVGGNICLFYMCYCNFINIYWKFILLCHLLLFL